MLLLTVEVAFLGRFRARLVRHVVVPVLASPSPARLDFPWSTEARIDAKVVQLCEHGQEQGLVLGGASERPPENAPPLHELPEGPLPSIIARIVLLQ